MNIGTYEIQTYTVMMGGSPVQRNRIIYTANNGQDTFIERYYGEIRDGYIGAATRFNDLNWQCLDTHVVGESIVVKDMQGMPLIYLTISSIQTVQRSGDLSVLILDSQVDPVTLTFLTSFDANQAYSMLNYLLQNIMIDLGSMSPDTMPPQIFFNDFFFGSHICIPGTEYAGPYSTADGSLFSTDIAASSVTFPISKSVVASELVYDVVDNRDDNMIISGSDISIYINGVSPGNVVDSISGTGSYVVMLELTDLVGNKCVTRFDINIV
jgi:hypothetical protein